jgi:hypothetical protein
MNPMKQEHYKAIYKNGKEESFYCFGFTEAIVLAMAYARNMAWDMAIESISNEHGQIAIRITPPEFKLIK